jgi:hypothetical protein
MAKGRPRPEIRAHEINFESFGVRVRLVADEADHLSRAAAVLPPGSRRSDGAAVDITYTLEVASPGAYELTRDGKTFVDDLSLDDAVWWLGRELSDLIAVRATDYVFVHAGAVAHKGRAIVMPGESHAGKSTLAAALVRAGAVYLSDDFAPFDAAGMVHPYARPLSIRRDGPAQVDYDVTSLGGVAGVEPVALGLVVLTRYRQGADWQPRQLSAGDAVLALMANTVRARAQPEQTLRALSRSLDGALALESERDEADAVAPLLLAELDRVKRGRS